MGQHNLSVARCRPAGHDYSDDRILRRYLAITYVAAQQARAYRDEIQRLAQIKLKHRFCPLETSSRCSMNSNQYVSSSIAMGPTGFYTE